MHPSSEIPLDKHTEEVNLAIMLRVGEVLERTKTANWIEHIKFD